MVYGVEMTVRLVVKHKDLRLLKGAPIIEGSRIPVNAFDIL